MCLESGHFSPNLPLPPLHRAILLTQISTFPPLLFLLPGCAQHSTCGVDKTTLLQEPAEFPRPWPPPRPHRPPCSLSDSHAILSPPEALSRPLPSTSLTCHLGEAFLAPALIYNPFHLPTLPILYSMYHLLTGFQSGFPNLSTVEMQADLCQGARPEHWEVFSSTCSLHPLNLVAS